MRDQDMDIGVESGVSPHTFETSLRMSHAASDWPGWEPFYRRAFPTFKSMDDYRHDGEHQRAGIDRSVTLTNSKQLLIDEKVRGRNKKTGKVYKDILLETLSDKRRCVPGWAVKQIRADYIAYLIAPLGQGYLLPTVQLQSAWAVHGDEWTLRYETREAYNVDPTTGRTWTTVSVPVPVPVLFLAIGAGLRVGFDPFEFGLAEDA